VTDPNNPPLLKPTGLLVIDKPLRLTSMAVCRKVKWLLMQGGAPKKVKVGHGGTLDPLATGVLVVLIGRATRLCDQVMAGEKRYTTEIDLAHISTTDDREGTITPVPIATPPTLEEIRAVCDAQTGTIHQKPPAHSAVWIGGERAYNLARRAQRDPGGPHQPPEMTARLIDIHEITIVDYRFPLLSLDIRCGKGTYIRSLARDFGVALGTGGMLQNLRRTAVGRFTIEEAQALDALPNPLLDEHLLAVPP
jgi:tRNA pseudouridine55 synthase